MNLSRFLALAVLIAYPNFAGVAMADQRLVGRWMRTENAGSAGYGGGYVGSSTVYTFAFQNNGVCGLKVTSRVNGTYGGTIVDSGRDKGQIYVGHYATEGGQIAVDFNDGSRIRGTYNVFQHNGQTMFKIHMPGNKPVYYYRQ